MGPSVLIYLPLYTRNAVVSHSHSIPCGCPSASIMLLQIPRSWCASGHSSSRPATVPLFHTTLKETQTLRCFLHFHTNIHEHRSPCWRFGGQGERAQKGPHCHQPCRQQSCPSPPMCCSPPAMQNSSALFNNFSQTCTSKPTYMLTLDATTNRSKADEGVYLKT